VTFDIRRASKADLDELNRLGRLCRERSKSRKSSCDQTPPATDVVQQIGEQLALPLEPDET